MSAKEKIIVKCKNHWLCLVPPCAIGLVFLLSALGYIFDGDFSSAVPMLIVAGLCALLSVIRYNYTSLVLTEAAIIGRVGIIKTHKLASPISKIQDVSVSSGLFGKIFKYSTITISTAGSGDCEYVFKRVTNGEVLQREFLTLSK